MNILVIDGHPDSGSLTAAMAARYTDGAGGSATLLPLRDLDFDLSLHGGYRRGQPLEADLARARELIERSDHITVLTPVWWGSVPALLKGFVDRTLEPRWAFRYKENGYPEGLLEGRTGRLVVTADSPRWYLPLVGDTTVRHVKRTTLEFCGIKPVRVTRFTDVRNADDRRRTEWLERCGAIGAQDTARAGRRTPARVAA